MDNVEAESDYIVIDGGIINVPYVKSLGLPVGAVREFVRRLTASDERIVRHIESLEWSVPHVWEFLRRLGKQPGLGTQIEAAVLDSLLRGLAGSTNGAGRTQVAKGRGKKPSINARMLETILANTEARGWTSPKWAKYLKCVKSSVVETPAWKNLKVGRDELKSQHALDRRRRAKGSDRNRD